MIRSHLAAVIACCLAVGNCCVAEEAAGDRPDAKEEAKSARQKGPIEPQALSQRVTLTYGKYGPPRSGPFVACDTIYAMQSISGLAHDADGKIDVSTRFEVVSDKGEIAFSSTWNRHSEIQDASDSHACGFVRLSDRPNKSGKYTWRCFAEDHVSGEKTLAEMPFELVTPTTLAAFNLRYSRDAQGQGSASAVFAVHEPFFIHASLANFGSQEGRTNVRCTARVLDCKGKDVGWAKVVKSLEVSVPVYDDNPNLWFYFGLNPVQAGKFLVQLQCEDLITGTSATEYLPLLVTEMPDWTLEEPRTAEKTKPESKRIPAR